MLGPPPLASVKRLFVQVSRAYYYCLCDASSIPQILRALRPPTSRQRVALTRAVFDMIDQDRDGLLSHDEV